MKDVLNKIIWTIPVLVIVSLANITKLHFLKKLANGLIMDKLGIYDLQKEIMSI